MIYDFLYLKRPFTHSKIPFMESFILKIQKIAFLSLPFSLHTKNRADTELIAGGITIKFSKQATGKKTEADRWATGCGRNWLRAQPWPRRSAPIFFELFLSSSRSISPPTIKFVSILRVRESYKITPKASLLFTPKHSLLPLAKYSSLS